MENGPFIDDFPIKTSIYKRFSMAMLNNQMVDISPSSCTTDHGMIMGHGGHLKIAQCPPVMFVCL
jgi:hypothetical protein